MEAEQTPDYVSMIRQKAKEMMPTDLEYHNFDNHVEDVYSRVVKSGRIAGLNPIEMRDLEVAAYLHEVGMKDGAEGHEERGAQFVKEYLKEIGYPEPNIEIVANMILATKLPQNPKTYLEKTLCDADVDNFGRDDFFENCERVRKELGIEESKEWYQNVLKLLKSHQYHTNIARVFRGPGKERNKKILELLSI